MLTFFLLFLLLGINKDFTKVFEGKLLVVFLIAFFLQIFPKFSFSLQKNIRLHAFQHSEHSEVYHMVGYLK